MRIFVDTEFMEDGETIELISIGAVREDGETFYAENAAADLPYANEWVKANVLPHLEGGKRRASVATIAATFEVFCSPPAGPTGQRVRPEFWGWCCAYDWVAICQLYGAMVDKPAGWPSYMRDLQHLLDDAGLSDDDLPGGRPGPAHNALADAREVQEILAWLEERDR